jgi:hypothetical protein
MNAAAIPQSTGDWFIRELEPGQKFATLWLSDDCIDAANRAAKMFDAGFPGWQLYSRIFRDDNIFDRTLAAWVIGLARYYTRSRKLNGRCVVGREARRNDWIAQAGLDALHCLACGAYPESAYARSVELGVDDKTYKRTRNVVCGAMAQGFRHYVNELHFQLGCVERDNRMGRTKYIFGFHPKPQKPGIA